jgi:hypothetical protein
MSKVAERAVQTNDVSSPSVSAECQERRPVPDLAVEEAIRRRIEENDTCTFYFNEVTCECVAGVLRVGGRVPTDRLKKILWSLIGDLDGVTEIDDQLDVVSSTGLSSIRPR